LLKKELARKNNRYFPKDLTKALIGVLDWMEPTQASRVCAEVARLLNEALAAEEAALYRFWRSENLAALAERMESREAARVCGEAVRTLNKALNRVTDADGREYVASGLTVLAAKMELSAATGILEKAFAQEKQPSARLVLARGLVAQAERMQPVQATRLCAEVARSLYQSLSGEKNYAVVDDWAKGLANVARGMELREAVLLLKEALAKQEHNQSRRELIGGLVVAGERIGTAEVVPFLSELLPQEKDAWACGELAQGLATVSRRMDPKEAARVCAKAVVVLLTGYPGRPAVRKIPCSCRVAPEERTAGAWPCANAIRRI
jgi:hypothetical protein